MIREKALLWEQALRSGVYQQARGTLSRIAPQGEDETVGDCCLGVLCKVAKADGLSINVSQATGRPVVYYDSHDAHLPQSVVEWADLEDNDPCLNIPPAIADAKLHRDSAEASALNDSYHFTFSEIADCVRYTYLGEEPSV
jgi:hypothetical protein